MNKNQKKNKTREIRKTKKKINPLRLQNGMNFNVCQKDFLNYIQEKFDVKIDKKFVSKHFVLIDICELL